MLRVKEWMEQITSGFCLVKNELYPISTVYAHLSCLSRIVRFFTVFYIYSQLFVGVHRAQSLSLCCVVRTIVCLWSIVLHLSACNFHVSAFLYLMSIWNPIINKLTNYVCSGCSPFVCSV